MVCTIRSKSSQFKWHYVVIFGLIRAMFLNTDFTEMYVTNVTVLRGDRGLTEVTCTPYDILETKFRLHGLACVQWLLEILKGKKERNEYVHVTQYYSH